MSSVTAVEICNRSLIRLGLGTIAGFGEETDKARTCDIMYPGIRDSALAMHPWRFATGKAELNRLVAEPVNEWKYAYQLPADLLSGPYVVFDSDATGALPIQQFEKFGDTIYADDERIIVDYRFRAAEAKWTPVFTEFIVFAVAAAIGMTLTDNVKLVTEYHVRAWGVPSDNMRGGYFAIASRENAQNNAADAIESDDLLVARIS